MSVKAIVRKQLLSVPFDNMSVTSVEVREINFVPGQETGRHRHPCPVVGYIAEGSDCADQGPTGTTAGNGRCVLRTGWSGDAI
jgi:hypothetical protein